MFFDALVLGRQDFHILEDLMKEFIHQDWRTQESEFRQEVLGSVALRQEFIRLIHQEDGSYLV